MVNIYSYHLINKSLLRAPIIFGCVKAFGGQKVCQPLVQKTTGYRLERLPYSFLFFLMLELLHSVGIYLISIHWPPNRYIYNSIASHAFLLFTCYVTCINQLSSRAFSVMCSYCLLQICLPFSEFQISFPTLPIEMNSTF